MARYRSIRGQQTYPLSFCSSSTVCSRYWISTATGSSSDENSERLHLVGSTTFYVLQEPTLHTVFRQANRPQKALISHEKALDWQELFELAVQQDLSPEDLKNIAYRVAGTYKSLLLRMSLHLLCQRTSRLRRGHRKRRLSYWITRRMRGRLRYPS